MIIVISLHGLCGRPTQEEHVGQATMRKRVIDRPRKSLEIYYEKDHV